MRLLLLAAASGRHIQITAAPLRRRWSATELAASFSAASLRDSFSASDLKESP